MARSIATRSTLRKRSVLAPEVGEIAGVVRANNPVVAFTIRTAELDQASTYTANAYTPQTAEVAATPVGNGDIAAFAARCIADVVRALVRIVAFHACALVNGLAALHEQDDGNREQGRKANHVSHDNLPLLCPRLLDASLVPVPRPTSLTFSFYSCADFAFGTRERSGCANSNNNHYSWLKSRGVYDNRSCGAEGGPGAQLRARLAKACSYAGVNSR